MKYKYAYKIIPGNTTEPRKSKLKFLFTICFIMTILTTSAVIIMHNPSLRSILNIEIKEDVSRTKFVLTNRNHSGSNFIETENEIEPSRLARQVDGPKFFVNKSSITPQGYYEEQNPVVVHAEIEPGVIQPDDDTYYKDDRQTDYEADPFYWDASSQGSDKERQLENDPSTVQSRQYDAYYNPWYHTKPEEEVLQNGQDNPIGKNRKMGTVQYDDRRRYQNPGYDSYSDYDYPSTAQTRPPERTSNTRLQGYRDRNSQISRTPQKRVQQQELQTTTAPESSSNESTLLSVVRGLKIAWDIYRAVSTAWNTIAEHRQKQLETQEKIKEDQLVKQARINSKKPTKFDSHASNATKPTRTPRPTKRPPRTTTTAKSVAKVEPRKQKKGDTESVREKRQSADNTSKDVAEGRYIKGDPLKGYYDFIITEGSYKFWAVFQVGTAILIIYSTFAAIYYSKVNPLVSDYDYTDYLGGARSLTGGDDDFVDDDDATVSMPSAKGYWYDWVPRVGHSLQFILDAIDKLPVDHIEKQNELEQRIDDVEWPEMHYNKLGKAEPIEDQIDESSGDGELLQL